MGTDGKKLDMNEIVKYNNDLNNYDIGKYSAAESDLFALVSFKLKGTYKSILTYDEVSEKLGIRKSHPNFKGLVKASATDIYNLSYFWDNEESFGAEHVFKRFKWDNKTETLEFEINEEFYPLFMNIQKVFTRFSLAEYLHVNGKHAKTLYRLLKQWRTQGKTEFYTLERFRFLFGLDKKYAINNIDKRIITPAIKELSPYFENLKVHKEYDNTHKGRGRKPLIGYSFSFTPEVVLETADQAEKKAEQKVSGKSQTQAEIAKKTGWQPTEWYCPECFQQMYRKEFTNANGSYVRYGHTDFKTGPCRYSTVDCADLLKKHQLPEEPLTEEQKANQAKLAEMISGMFGKK